MGLRVTSDVDWVWMAAMVFTGLTACLWWISGQPQIRRNPDLRAGYVKLVRGVLIWGNIPWLIMEMGLVCGGARISDFSLRSSNSFALAFDGSVLLILGLGTNWILRGGGAEMVVAHPGLFNITIERPLTVKIVWLLCAVVGLVGMIVA